MAGDFSLLVQRKVTKRKDTPGRSPRIHRAVPVRTWARRPTARPFDGAEVHRTSANTPPHPREAGRSPNSPAAHNAARARSKGSRLPPASLRCSARDTGTQKPNRGRVLLHTRMARPSIAAGPGVVAHPVSSPRRVSQRPASWGARRDRREAQGVVAPSGRAFFWVLFFARAKKSTSPAVREPQLHTRPQAARQLRETLTPWPRSEITR
jgi:hypothetical protein